MSLAAARKPFLAAGQSQTSNSMLFLTPIFSPEITPLMLFFAFIYPNRSEDVMLPNVTVIQDD